MSTIAEGGQNRSFEYLGILLDTVGYHLMGYMYERSQGCSWLGVLKRLLPVYQKIVYADHSMGEGAKIPRGADSEI